MSVKYEPLLRGPWRWVQNSGEWLLVTDHSGQKVVLGTVADSEKLDMDGQPFMDVLAVRDETGMLVPLTPDSPLGRALVALPDIIEAAKALNFAACTGRLAIDEIFEKVTTRMEEALSLLWCEREEPEPVTPPTGLSMCQECQGTGNGGINGLMECPVCHGSGVSPEPGR